MPAATDADADADATVVVGIGADGWAGLAPAGRCALATAEIVVGSARQLAGLDGAEGVSGRRITWPGPLPEVVPEVLAEHAGRRVVILASGDPLFFGIGATLVRLLGARAVRVVPHPSSVALACARLGWPSEDVEVVSLVGRPMATVHPRLQPGRRLLVLVSAPDAAERVAAYVTSQGYGPSEVVVLEQLGGAGERIRRFGPAETSPTEAHDPLAVVALELRAAPGTRVLARTPGLPDDLFGADGQLTKREVRAITLSALAPAPGQLLWDVGAGSGSIGIEWMRAHPANRAVAVEPRADRRERIATNAAALGVPGLQIVAGTAPEALAGLPTPNAVFVGGGLTAPGLLDACRGALTDGGRLVANAVTLESEAVLTEARARWGGDLIRIAVQRAEPVGGFTGWRPAMPVTQWSLRVTP